MKTFKQIKWKIIFCLLYILPNLLVAQADKQIDNFSATGSYYTSASGGTVSLSVANITGQEGSSCLRVNYNINNTTGNYLEIFRGFHTSTKDLSFSPSSITFMVRGATNDVLRFMLYEDINMNGNAFDPGDEVYQYSQTIQLNDAGWRRITMPYNMFTGIVGGGDNQLNLNRIGAWRILINNASGSSASRDIYIDDLRQHTTYVPATSGGEKLSGSFIQLWNDSGCKCGNWTQADWETQMQHMKNACLDKIIIQYGVYDTHSWYSQSTLPYVNTKSSAMNRMFPAALNKGIDIYIGLYFDETWNHSAKDQSATYTNILNKHKQVIDELTPIFGSHARFKGWYIPQEINDLEWQSTTNRNLLANWLRDVAAYAKSKTPTKEVVIAPFFGPHRPADDLQAWWDYVLGVATGIDLVIPQDGVGTTTKDVDVDIPHYFNAIKNACTARGRRFGATIETFQQTSGWPINNGNFAAVPATMDRLKTQLWEAGRFVSTSDMFQFEWPYMQPGLSAATQTLYNDYRSLYCSPLSNKFISNDAEGNFDKKAFMFNVSPNPFNDQLNISVNKPDIRLTSVVLTDLSGRVVYENISGSGDVINVDAKLNPGTYMLILQTEEGSQVMTLVKY
ncbi:MAG: DUF4434 domain-containing protein [Cytophagaceae bacterium]